MVLEIASSIGLATILGGFLYIGKKLQILSSLSDDMKKVKINLQTISNTLIASDMDFDHGRLEAFSPVQLTQNGNDFLQEVGFQTTFNEYSQDFYNCIKENDPQNDYDIEQAAIKSVFFLFDKPYFSTIKEYLYNNPKEDKKEVLHVAGIYVRDKYMSQVNNKEAVNA